MSLEERQEEELDRRTAVMCQAGGLIALSIATCVPARAPLVLSMMNGDAAATAQTMGLMSTAAAAIEVLMNPVLGRLSDKYGRKPFLVMAPCVTAALHLGVAAAPKNLKMNFADRCISGALIFGFMSPMAASFQDLWARKDLTKMAGNLAKYGSNIGLGFAAGPLIGAKLGGEKAFAVSALLFLSTAGFIVTNFEETLPEQERKEFDITAINPFSFVKLFQTSPMRTLSATIGLSSFAEYANIYDINFLFLKTVMGWGQEQVGKFAASFGVTQILGGLFSKKIIESVGLDKYSKMAFAAYIAGFGLLGSSKNAAQLAGALFCLLFGHQRALEAGTLLGEHAAAKGMGRGEIQGAQANLLAMLKIIAPLMYGKFFAYSTSGGRSKPGAPYFLICAFLVAAQGTFMTYDRSSLPKKK